MRMMALIALLLPGPGAEAAAPAGPAPQFVPPAGYDGTPGPAVATPAEPGSPPLVRIPDATLQPRFRVDPGYRNVAHAHVRVIGAYRVAETGASRLTGAWGRGFLPVTLSFSDGRCFTFQADYTGGTLSRGRLNRTECAHPTLDEAPPPAPPAARRLRPVGTSWGFAAWLDPRTRRTVITEPWAKTFSPYIVADMQAMAILAMIGPDWPGGNMTLVGRVGGKPVIVTLDVGY